MGQIANPKLFPLDKRRMKIAKSKQYRSEFCLFDAAVQEILAELAICSFQISLQ